MATTVFYAKPSPSGTKDGLSYANAAGIDPGAADEVWSLAATELASNPVDVRLLADSSVTITATVSLATAGTSTKRMRILGYSADGLTQGEVTLDADGGAFPVFTMTQPHHEIWNVHAYNTSQAAGMNGFSLTATAADKHVFYNCRASTCYRGFSLTSGANYNLLYKCRAHNNSDEGFYAAGGYEKVCILCEAYDNGQSGFYVVSCHDCLSFGNGDDGYSYSPVCCGCVAYDNTDDGFIGLNAYSSFYRNCIAAENGGYGYSLLSGRLGMLDSCASYLNTSGRIETGGLYSDIDGITCTADPFVDAANDDFRINYTPGGGALVRRIEQAFPGGLTTSWPDIGAAQSLPSRRPRALQIGV